jgi:hypothetical protein
VNTTLAHREQNRDFQDDILAEGHMTLLALEASHDHGQACLASRCLSQMKLAVEKRAADIAKGEVSFVSPAIYML